MEPEPVDPKTVLARAMKEEGPGGLRKAVLELPFLPTRASSPNTRGHWVARYKANRKLKEDTFMLAMSKQVPAFEKARITIVYVVKDNRRRDGDNWLSMAKGIIDGMVEAKVFKDDSAEYISFAPFRFVVDKGKSPMTII